MSAEDNFLKGLMTKVAQPGTKVEFFKEASFVEFIDLTPQKLANVDMPMPDNKGSTDFGFGQGIQDNKMLNPAKMVNKPVDMFKAPNQPNIMKGTGPSNASGVRGLAASGGKDTGFNPI